MSEPIRFDADHVGLEPLLDVADARRFLRIGRLR
jgi:hypothetical protein